MPQIRRLCSLVALSLSAGCYDYHVSSSPTAETGNIVRVSLTDQGSIDLAPLIGPQVTKLDGTLVSAADTSLLMRVSSVINRTGFSSSWSGEQLRVPRQFVAGVERRTLNRRKSWLVGGGSLAAVAVVGMGFSLIGTDGRPRQSGPGGGPR